MILYMYGSVVGVMGVGRYKSDPMEGGMGAECLHRGVWGQNASIEGCVCEARACVSTGVWGALKAGPKGLRAL